MAEIIKFKYVEVGNRARGVYDGEHIREASHQAAMLMYDIDGVEYYESQFGLTSVKISVIKVAGGVRLLHNTSDPAFYHASGTVVFFVYGWQVLIDDLPCDEETKCLLKLRYVRVEDSYHYVYGG